MHRWIFGYGSLMWRPGFDYIDRREAILFGYHRAFCVYSHVHRGTPDCPGLVLGLDRGGSCRGVAFAVSDENWPEVRQYLIEREQVTAVYMEAVKPTHTAAARNGGREIVNATCFLVDRTHVQYAGTLSLDDQARLIRQGMGRSGHNEDYLVRTVDHLDEMGIRDGPVHALYNTVRRGRPKL